MKDPVLGKNKLLRQAISMTLNTDVWVELFYNGRAIPAQGPIPPGITGYDPNLKNPNRQYNLQKAKELLAKAGYPEGKGLPELIYLTGTGTTLRQMSEFIAKGLLEVGIKVKIEALSWPEFQAAYKAGKGQIYGHAWNADYPDAENFFQLFYSKNHAPGPNDSFFTNKEFDQLFEKSLTMSDSTERTAIYHKLVQILIEETPWVFGVHRIGYALNQARLKNVKPHDFEHNEFKYYRPEDSAAK